MTTTIDGVKTIQIKRAKNGDFDLNFARVCDCSYLENAILNAYPAESESGNPIYFDDGADNIPVKELIVSLEPKQSGSGDPSPSNVRQITGYDGVTVKRLGKNLFKPAVRTITASGVTYSVNSNGKITLSGTCTGDNAFTIYMGFMAPFSGTYTVSLSGAVSAKVNGGDSFSAYANKGNPLTAFTITITNGITYNESFNAMIELGSTATEYEPYTEQTYSITFPTSAGTVYGGRLNVTTGELVVDKKAITIDSTLAINKSTTYKGSFYTGYVESIFGIKNNNSHGTLICSHGKYIGSPRSSFVYGTCALDSAINLFLGTEAMTIAEFKTWLDEQKSNGTPVVVVGDLITPQTYQLTPTEVSTLLGSNTIQSDGSMDLTYRADINKIIERLENA